MSELADQFVSDPATVVKVAQQVEVTVLEVDLPRQRIALSLRTNPGQPRRQPKAQEIKGGAPARPQKRQEKGHQQKPEPAPQTALGRAFANLKLEDKK